MRNKLLIRFIFSLDALRPPGVNVCRRFRREIFAALVDGTLQLEIGGRYTLDEVEIAHAALEERRQLGKSVLLIASPPTIASGPAGL